MSQITVSHLTFAYDGACDNVFEDVSFVLDTDWRLGFTGRNGRGKTTFLKLLDGTLVPAAPCAPAYPCCISHSLWNIRRTIRKPCWNGCSRIARPGASCGN